MRSRTIVPSTWISLFLTALLLAACSSTAASGPAPLVLPPPIALEVDFAHTHMADMAELVPGSTRPGGRTVRFIADDYLEIFRAFRAFSNLSSIRD